MADKYCQTTVCLPAETKRRVRVFAANLGISMGKAALLLIEQGINEIKSEKTEDSKKILPESIPAQSADGKPAA
jgi:hypothetical protein